MNVWLVKSLIDRSYNQIVAVCDTYQLAYEEGMKLTADTPHLKHRLMAHITEMEVLTNGTA